MVEGVRSPIFVKIIQKLYNQHIPKFGMSTFISKLALGLINEVAESGTEYIYFRKTTSFINLKGG